MDVTDLSGLSNSIFGLKSPVVFVWQIFGWNRSVPPPPPIRPDSSVKATWDIGQQKPGAKFCQCSQDKGFLNCGLGRSRVSMRYSLMGVYLGNHDSLRDLELAEQIEL